MDVSALGQFTHCCIIGGMANGFVCGKDLTLIDGAAFSGLLK